MSEQTPGAPKTEFRNLEALQPEQVDILGSEPEEIDKLIEKARQLGWSEDQLLQMQADLMDLATNLVGAAGEDLKGKFEIYKQKLSDFQEKLTSATDALGQSGVGGDTSTESNTPKKGFFKRAWDRIRHPVDTAKDIKEAVFNKEVGKVAAETAYKTVTSVAGVKFATDFVMAFIPKLRESSDQYKYFKGKQELKDIHDAFSSYLKGHEELSTGSESAAEVQGKYDLLKTKVTDAKYLDNEAKGKFLNKIDEVKKEFEDAEETARKEKQKKMEDIVGAYLVNKVQGTTIAKDALNTACTASGLMFARGAIYGSMAVIERAAKTSRANQQAEVIGGEKISMAKDLFVNATVETARGLLFMGSKKQEDISGKQRVMDFVKSFGTVARIFGISATALQGIEAPSQMMTKLAESISNHGIAVTAGENFLHNGEHLVQIYTHPIDTLHSAYDKVIKSLGGEQPARIESSNINNNHTENIFNKMKAEIDKQITEATKSLEESSKHTAEVAAAATLAKQQIESAADAVAHTPEIPVHPAGEIEAPKEIAGFGDWRHQVMEKMGYKFEHGNIEHALMFHKGAQIDLTDSNGKVIDTYVFKQGGSTWAAMDKFHHDHPELFSDKDKIPGIRITNNLDTKGKSTVDVLQNYRIESHVGGKTSLDHSAVKVEVPVRDLGPNEFKNGSWATQKEAPTMSFTDAKHITHVYETDPENVDAKTRIVDDTRGKFFGKSGQVYEPVYSADKKVPFAFKDSQGHTFEAKTGEFIGTAGTALPKAPGRIDWSIGHAVKDRSDLEAMLKGSGGSTGGGKLPEAPIMPPTKEIPVEVAKPVLPINEISADSVSGTAGAAKEVGLPGQTTAVNAEQPVSAGGEGKAKLPVVEVKPETVPDSYVLDREKVKEAVAFLEQYKSDWAKEIKSCFTGVVIGDKTSKMVSDEIMGLIDKNKNALSGQGVGNKEVLDMFLPNNIRNTNVLDNFIKEKVSPETRLFWFGSGGDGVVKVDGVVSVDVDSSGSHAIVLHSTDGKVSMIYDKDHQFALNNDNKLIRKQGEEWLNVKNISFDKKGNPEFNH